jgi:hypothetical protein
MTVITCRPCVENRHNHDEGEYCPNTVLGDSRCDCRTHEHQLEVDYIVRVDHRGDDNHRIYYCKNCKRTLEKRMDNKYHHVG